MPPRTWRAADTEPNPHQTQADRCHPVQASKQHPATYRNIHPERQVVHARERHVRRADLQRHKVVTKAAEKRRNNHKEHHQDTVVGDHNVPEVAVWRTVQRYRDETRAFQTHVLHTGVHQLEAHVDGESNGDETTAAATNR